MSKATDFVYAILPRSIREQLLRGKISQGAVNNSFIYDDNGILKRLNAVKCGEIFSVRTGYVYLSYGF